MGEEKAKNRLGQFRKLTISSSDSASVITIVRTETRSSAAVYRQLLRIAVPLHFRNLVPVPRLSLLLSVLVPGYGGASLQS